MCWGQTACNGNRLLYNETQMWHKCVYTGIPFGMAWQWQTLHFFQLNQSRIRAASEPRGELLYSIASLPVTGRPMKRLNYTFKRLKYKWPNIKRLSFLNPPCEQTEQKSRVILNVRAKIVYFFSTFIKKYWRKCIMVSTTVIKYKARLIIIRAVCWAVSQHSTL